LKFCKSGEKGNQEQIKHSHPRLSAATYVSGQEKADNFSRHCRTSLRQENGVSKIGIANILFCL
jgi:hypothetical protein